MQPGKPTINYRCVWWLFVSEEVVLIGRQQELSCTPTGSVNDYNHFQTLSVSIKKLIISIIIENKQILWTSNVYKHTTEIDKYVFPRIYTRILIATYSR